MSNLKSIDLFEGLAKGLLENEGGYITTSFFDLESNYVIFETISYVSVKNVYQEEDGVIFQTDGKKLYTLFEPREYIHKHIEPTFREEGKKIPFRYEELETFMTNRNDKIMVAKIPFMSYNSFTIAKPSKGNFAVYFYLRDDVIKNLLEFYKTVFEKDLHLQRSLVLKVLDRIAETLSIFKDFN